MNWQLTVYHLPLLASALASLGLAGAIWQRRQTPGAKALALLALAAGWWCVFYGLELSRSDLAGMLFFARLEYLAIVAIPLAWLVFVLQFTGRRPRRSQLLLLALVPLTTVLLVWSNDLHGLMWRQVGVLPGRFAQLTVSYGWAFWLHTAYSYILFTAGLLLLGSWLWRFGRRYRAQAVTFVLGAILPFLGNALYLTRFGPEIDITPMSFAVASGVLAWGIFRQQLLDLVPIARNLVIDSMDAAVLVLDARRRVVDINAAALGYFALEHGDVIGKPLIELLQPWPELAGVFASAARDPEAMPRHPEAMARHPEAMPRHQLVAVGEQVFDLRVTPLERWGQSLGHLLILRDITDRARVEAELRRAKERSEAANRAKSQFLATMSHELRTPLTSVIGFADMFAAEAFGPLNDAQKEYIGEILGAGRQLQLLINDVLDYANLENDSLHFRPVKIDLPALLRAAEREIRPLAERKGLSFELELPAELPLLYSDAPKLQRVLAHLLGNAVKFTEEGGVTLRVRHEQGELQLEVCDTGIGIAEEQQRLIFDAFTQAEMSDTRKYGGTGLGLAISQRYVTLLGGRIELVSRPGEGATFTVSLPLREVASVPPVRDTMA